MAATRCWCRSTPRTSSTGPDRGSGWSPEGGFEFRTTPAGYGGKSYLGLRKDQLAELGLAAGDEITVSITADT